MIEELRPKLAAIPGIRVYLQDPPLIRIGGQLTKSHSCGLYLHGIVRHMGDKLHFRRKSKPARMPVETY